MLMIIGGILALIWGIALLKIVWNFIFPDEYGKIEHMKDVCMGALWFSGALLFCAFWGFIIFVND